MYHMYTMYQKLCCTVPFIPQSCSCCTKCLWTPRPHHIHRRCVPPLRSLTESNRAPSCSLPPPCYCGCALPPTPLSSLVTPALPALLKPWGPLVPSWLLPAPSLDACPAASQGPPGPLPVPHSFTRVNRVCCTGSVVIAETSRRSKSQ